MNEVTYREAIGRALLDAMEEDESVILLGEEAEGRARDPLTHARARLLAEGLAEGAELDRIDRAAGEEMDEALAFAAAAPVPGGGTLFEDVYAPGQPQPRPQRDRLRAILGEAA